MRTPTIVASCTMLACVLGISTITTIPTSVPEPTANTGLDKSMDTMHAEDAEGSLLRKPDADFALMMIPHHRGAIEMAEVELQFGADSRLRRLAQEIIVTQQSEIEVMKVAISDYPISSLNQRRTNWCTR